MNKLKKLSLNYNEALALEYFRERRAKDLPTDLLEQIVYFHERTKIIEIPKYLGRIVRKFAPKGDIIKFKEFEVREGILYIDTFFPVRIEINLEKFGIFPLEDGLYFLHPFANQIVRVYQGTNRTYPINTKNLGEIKDYSFSNQDGMYIYGQPIGHRFSNFSKMRYEKRHLLLAMQIMHPYYHRFYYDSVNTLILKNSSITIAIMGEFC